MVDKFDPGVPGQILSFSHRIVSARMRTSEHTYPMPDGSSGEAWIYQFLTSFSCRYYEAELNQDGTTRPVIEDGENKDELLAEINAEFAADYFVSKDNIPDDASIKQWSGQNAVLHCWPYWREHAHSMMAKMGLPVIMLPLFNAVPQIILD